MARSLEELLLQLHEEEGTLSSSNEEAAKQAAVLPILSLLGWDVHNTVDEVCPEYPCGTDRVDYCLKVAGKPRVLVEAKKPSEDLGKYEEQLLRYSYEDSAEMGVVGKRKNHGGIRCGNRAQGSHLSVVLCKNRGKDHPCLRHLQQASAV